jgi:hypothetical protein
VANIDRHRPTLDELAKTLLSNEVLERADIDRVIGDTPSAAPRRIGELGIAAATAEHPAQPPKRRQ